MSWGIIILGSTINYDRYKMKAEQKIMADGASLIQAATEQFVAAACSAKSRKIKTSDQLVY